MATLRLGNVDKGMTPSSIADFLAPYHISMDENLQRKHKFRDEGNDKWTAFKEIKGSRIQEIQRFLKEAGFMPKANIDGVFGYGTTAAVRLFQEYVRTVEGKSNIGIPDGVVGQNTARFIREWREKRSKESPQYICDWGKASLDNPSEAYTHWMSLLEKGRAHYAQQKENPVVKHIEEFGQPTDTKKIDDWDTKKETIHIIGIRRNQERSYVNNRINDDLFVLLLNGMAFYFWGSTDPNPGVTQRTDIPFLIEGQHLYRFGWHKVTNEKKIYKALRPASDGVLVFRDKDGNQALTEAEWVQGLDPTPNKVINIHWSGVGTTNFSAGCQVIAGASYINHREDIINCRHFAATSYDELGGRKTRGAYNLLADLILTYAPAGVQTLAYTLTRDDTAFLSDQLTVDIIGQVVERLQKNK